MLPDTSNLPADITSFVGRRRELAQAKDRLSEARALTMIGVGGVGKTRLALRLASEVSRAFPDGVWLVELAPLREERLLAQTIVRVLGIREQFSDPSIEVLCEFLAGRRLLLILDNCEHLLEACASLASRLLRAAPHLRILATSRQPLKIPGEFIMDVPALPVPAPEAEVPLRSLADYDAVTLFVERARALLQDFTLDEQNALTVNRICHQLDGIPLAIELAVSQLRTLTLEQILDRLDDRLQLLKVGRGHASPRQQTLRAAIDWSYELCSFKERLLWARLSVFSGSLDLESAEEVCAADGIDRAEILELMSGLVDKSIIGHVGSGGPARYQLLETIRQYGYELLAGSGDDVALRRRHRDWFAHLAEEAEAAWTEPSQAEWLTRLAQNHANLGVALEFSLTQPGGARGALKVGSALWPYWLASGAFTEARHWLDLALALDQEPTQVRAKALWVNAWHALAQGDTAEGVRFLTECHRLAESLDDQTAAAWATQWSGRAAMLQRDVPRAAELFSDALNRHRSLGNWSGVVVTLYHLALATSLLGDSRAAEIGEEMLALCEQRRLPWSTSYALWTVGLEMFRQGNRARATALLRDSVRLRQAFNDRLGLALCLEVLAWTAGAEGRHLRAAELCGAAQLFWRATAASLTGYGRLATSHDECEAQAQAALGQETFREAVKRGQALSLDDAVALALDEQPTRPAGEADTAYPLTRREREVAVLVTQGMSNREIATRLVIAERTAEGHVEHIMTKLGVNSRTKIAVWATEHLDGARPDKH
jgi:predicted ATPase/DNA-binding CsgD family transcriptional regulator